MIIVTSMFTNFEDIKGSSCNLGFVFFVVVYLGSHLRFFQPNIFEKSENRVTYFNIKMVQGRKMCNLLLPFQYLSDQNQKSFDSFNT